MSEAEAAFMQEHAAYRNEAPARRRVVAFGLVADPAGAHGIGVVEFPGEAHARAFTDGGPTIRSGEGFRLEVHLMPFGVVHG